MILNTFSTALMTRLGHTYRSFMVDMRATNAKLRGRNLELLVQATGCAEAEAVRALDACGGEVKTAVVHLLTGRPPRECRDRLAASGGRVRRALE